MLRIEQLSSITHSTGAHQHQSRQVQLSSNSYTSLVDKQEDAGSTLAADGDDYDRDQEQHSPVIKLDDQCELASEGHASLVINKHVDESRFSRTMALLVQPETDRKEYRYDDNHRLSAQQSYVIVLPTWFDDAVPRKCHLTNYESANQDSRQRPLTVSLQAISDRPTASTSRDNYRRLLYPCRQYIRLRYSLTFDSAMSSSLIANSNTALRRTDWLQQLCNDPSVRPISFHSFEVVGTSTVASTSPLLSLTTTARSSIDVRSGREMASPQRTCVPGEK